MGITLFQRRVTHSVHIPVKHNLTNELLGWLHVAVSTPRSTRWCEVEDVIYPERNSTWPAMIVTDGSVIASPVLPAKWRLKMLEYIPFITPHQQKESNNTMKSFKEVVDECHEAAVTSGWWSDVNPNDPYVFGTKLALVHSEVSEALEGGRKNKMDDHLPHRKAEEVELADACIRIFDLAGARKLDLYGAIIEKMAYNAVRADHKPENRAAEGGKKF